MQRRFAFMACLVICVAAVGVLSPKYGSGKDALESEPAASEPALMRAKLASSQKVLEGLLTEDFELIRQGAKDLHEIGEAARWRTAQDPVYDHYSTEFRRLSEKLIRQAAEKNADGAAFSHMHLTTVCISCHEHVRDVVRLADDQASPANRGEADQAPAGAGSRSRARRR